MKRTSRKKVLLSSVAMMMVATVSLGSATYAWFTNQTTATAKTMTVKANAAIGLKIMGDNDTEWKTDATFDNNGNAGVALNPVSVNYTDGAAITKITTATASSATVVTGITDVSIPSFSDPVKNSDDYAVYQFKAAYTGEDADQYLYLTGLTIKDTVSGKNAANYARAAIIDNSTKSVVDVFDLTGGTTAALNGSSSTDAQGKFVAGTTDVTTTAQAEKGGLDIKLSSSKLTKTDAEKPLSFSVLVWFEGQDADCKDDNAGNTAEIEMFFEMKGQ